MRLPRASRAEVPARRRVRQRMSLNQWVQRALLCASILCLVVCVVLPLHALVRRSTREAFTVAIWGPDDVRAAGRRIQFVSGEVLVDGESLGLHAGMLEHDGVRVRVEDDGIREVHVSQVVLGERRQPVASIHVAIDGDEWAVDGVVLDPDTFQRQVERSIGLRLFRDFFAEPGRHRSLLNSVYVASVSSGVSVTLAFLFAYGLARTCMPGKAVLRVVALLPLFAPTMLYGLSLVYLFGNRGLITTGLFGRVPWLAFDIGLYGPVGIILAEVVFVFPPAFIILTVALSATDARLYEAARSLGASPARVFLTVTLPGVKFGLLNAAMVCFTLAFTDFGAPKVVGGGYPVLAMDIYRQVVGQHNFSMGATVSVILLVPALFAFAVERIAQRRQVSLLTGRSVPYTPGPLWYVDTAYFVICSAVAGFILMTAFAAGAASLVRVWPYDFAPTLAHYRFEGAAGGGYEAFWNSVRVALCTAAAGTAVTFVSAWLVEKTRRAHHLRWAAYGLSVLPLALPGLVLGIAYITFFNRPEIVVPFSGFPIPNPFRFIYGTLAILVAANIVHFYSVSFLTATTALRQLDGQFESVGESMGVPPHKTFFRVTVPICAPAILEIATFYFVSSMATVSAVIFLYSAHTRVASVAVVSMDDAGELAAASAMCMLIVLTNLAARGLFEVLHRAVRTKLRVASRP